MNLIKKIFKIFKYRYYYLLMYSHKKLGKNLFDIHSNGELTIAKKIIMNLRNPIVFDIGANIGDWSSAIIEVSPEAEITIFEPNPNLFKNLNERFNLNSNVDVKKLALNHQEDIISFYLNESLDAHGNNSIYNHYYLEPSSQKVEVQCVSLDKYCDDNNISYINFIKADIEGAEINLLRGASRMLQQQKIDFLQIEYNQTWIKAGGSLLEVFEICKLNNYSLYRIGPTGLIKISFYTYTLEDFVFQNLLMVSCNANIDDIKILEDLIPKPQEVAIEL